MYGELNRFDRRVVAGKTYVKIEGKDEWFLVTEVHETRKWIKIDGIGGSFQWGHVTQFTNKKEILR